VIETCTAIVLRPTPFEEGSAIVSFLTEHGERITGLAKGAKKPSSKWVSAFEPLALVKVGFFGKEQSEIRRITRCELLHSPLTLGNLDASLVLACLADVFDRVAREGVEDDRLFRLLSACARALKTQPGRAMAVLAYAEHWLLHCLGVLPHPRVCGSCGREVKALALLDDERGWCCTICTPVDPHEALPAGSLEHLRHLRTRPVDEAPEVQQDPAARAVTHLLRHRLLRELGGNLKSYSVLFQMVAF